MMFTFGARSVKNLDGLHPDLVAVATRAISVSEVDFTVIEGFRSPDRQHDLVRAGASKTNQSKHLIGHAIDVAAWVSGAPSWDWHLYPPIAAAMQAASRELSVPVVWGAIWDRQLASLTLGLQAEVFAYMSRHAGKDFLDFGHFELRLEPPVSVTTT